MFPEKFKDMFGLKDEKDMKMANNIWKMLEEMSSNDPQTYDKFIQKNITEGLTDAKAEKQKKQKPYKLTPLEYMLLQMEAELQEECIGQIENQQGKDQQFKEKLDMNINKEKWSDVRNKFQKKIHIFLNICHTDRVKNPTSKSKNGAEIKDFNISMMRDIQNLYYSLQGPSIDNKDKKSQLQNWHFCMIFNTGFLRAFESVPQGKRVFLGVCTAYFQQRIKADRNPILLKVNTHSLYGKNLYYGIDKPTIQVCQDRKFKYGEYKKPCQFLLQKQIDTKKRQSDQKDEINKKPQKSKKQTEIVIKPQNKIQDQPELTTLLPTTKPQKKVLIQVLQEKQTDQNKNDSQNIPYEMKQTEEGYFFDFLVVGVQKIDQLDLQVSKDTLNLKYIKVPLKKVEIKLKQNIDEDKVKAKMKRKTHTLQVNLYF